MAKKGYKRLREDSNGAGDHDSPAKRSKPASKQPPDDKVHLSKLYQALYSESSDVRLEAAEQLIVRFSPTSNPSAADVEKALERLVRGLCTQNKAARLGFSVTLTELLQRLFGHPDSSVGDFDANVDSVLELVEETTKVKGSASADERRNHLIGRLFGYKAILQSSILLGPKLSLECWNKLLDQICGMARDIPWLREECGMTLVEAVKSLASKSDFEVIASELIQRLVSSSLANTAEGVAVWLIVRESYENVLPTNVWHQNDPLCRKERTRLAKILKGDFSKASENGEGETVKSGAAANPNPNFSWSVALSEILQRDTRTKGDRKDAVDSEFSQFWLDTVDSTLFASTASLERKSWGFKLFASMVDQAPDWALSALFSPNFMRTLINQTKMKDRFLHLTALKAWKAVQLRAQHVPHSTRTLFVSLTSKNGTADFDHPEKIKTLEEILLSADDRSLKKIVQHLHSLVLRPDTTHSDVADKRRQTIADMLLYVVRNYKRYDSIDPGWLEKDNWLQNIIETMVENAYFVPSQRAKTSKVPLPLISESSRKVFQERLSSCLTKLLDVGTRSRTLFAMMVMRMIRSKATSSKYLVPVFKADKPVMATVEKAFQALEGLTAQDSIASQTSAAEGFVLLYSLSLLQVYNGDGDAVLILEDLDNSRTAMLMAEDAPAQGHDGLMEIILSFLGNPQTLFRNIAEEVFTMITPDITSESLQSLAAILDTHESLEGQRELFAQEGEDVESAGSSEDVGESSDVEMIDDEGSDAQSDSENDSEEEDEEEDNEDDAELTQFNNMLAMTLQTSKPAVDGEAADDTSDESDMDDEQMMALDPHLSNIFRQRGKRTKKKERVRAKKNMVQFKSRVLDLLAIYVEREFSNPLSLGVLLPILRRTRPSADKQLADKSGKLIKAWLDVRKKHKRPLPKPEDEEPIWEILKGVHEEATMGLDSHLHASSCSSASLHVVKILVGINQNNYARVVDLYAEAQKRWFMDKGSRMQPAMFTQFLNWSVERRKQGK